MDPRQNRLHRVILMALAGSALIACAATPDRTAETREPVDLSGDWVINEELSDRPSDVLSGVGKQASAAVGILQSIGRSISVFGISVGQIAAMLPDHDDDEEATPEFPREITDPMGELKVAQASDTVEVTTTACLPSFIGPVKPSAMPMSASLHGGRNAPSS